jgi:hypothetical protein
VKTPLEDVKSEKRDLKPAEAVDLIFSVIQDTKIQQDIPRAIEVALAALRAGAEQGQISILQVVDKVFEAVSSLKEHPAVQTLLPHWTHCLLVLMRFWKKRRFIFHLLLSLSSNLSLKSRNSLPTWISMLSKNVWFKNGSITYKAEMSNFNFLVAFH